MSEYPEYVTPVAESQAEIALCLRDILEELKSIAQSLAKLAEGAKP